MRVLGVDPGPKTHGAVVYDTVERRVVWSSGRATFNEVDCAHLDHGCDLAVIERPTVMGALGPGIIGHLLDTAWTAGELSVVLGMEGPPVQTMTRREVLRYLGVLSGKGSADSRVRAACIEDHQTPGGSPAIGRKASPGPLYGVSSHAWQALGLVLAYLHKEGQDNEE